MSEDRDKQILNSSISSYDNTITLKEKQEESLLHIIKYANGCDVVISLPTGYGKSMVYTLLPHALRLKRNVEKGMVMVVCPLNIIQQDQIMTMTAKGVRACRLSVTCSVTTAREEHGLMNWEATCSVEDVEQGLFDVVFCHPEALFCTKEGRELLESREFRKNIIAVVVDECHTVELW